MLHPSYTDLMEVVNHDETGEEHPVVNSRYSIVLATAKRARQLIGGAEPYVEVENNKALSIAIEELYRSKVKILSEEDTADEEEFAENAEVAEETEA